MYMYIKKAEKKQCCSDLFSGCRSSVKGEDRGQAVSISGLFLDRKGRIP